MLNLVRDAALKLLYRHSGIEAVNTRLLRAGRQEELLTAYGASLGAEPIIHGPTLIHNADPDYRNLTIGRRVHIGRGVLLDLTDELVIEDEAVISMGCTILTHADIGDRPLSGLYPRQSERMVIGAGAYLGANVTVLCGAHIGAGSVVGAGAVVTKPVPSQMVVAGIPAQIVKTLTFDGTGTSVPNPQLAL